MTGLVICTREDYLKTKSYVDFLTDELTTVGFSVKLVFEEDSIYGIENFNVALVEFQSINMSEVSFAINRTRNSKLAFCLAQKGIKVFNNYEVCRIANDKIQSYKNASLCKHIKIADTYFVNKKQFKASAFSGKYPLVVKDPYAFGNSNVFFAENQADLVSSVRLTKPDIVVLQKRVDIAKYGDIRVYVIGSKIVGAVRKNNICKFKSGYSKAYDAISIPVEGELKKQIDDILTSNLYFDFVGIDFVIDSNNNIFFNEIEDVIGSMNYIKLSNVNTAKLFAEHIKSKM